MTIRGFGVLFLAAFCGLISVLYASQMMLTLSAFFFLLLLVNFLWLRAKRKKVDVNRSTSPEVVYENSEVNVKLNVANVKTDVTLLDKFENGQKTARFFLNKIKGKETVELNYKIAKLFRGVYKIGPVHITETDFLGLFAKNYVLKDETELRVYPKISDVTLPAIPLRSSEQSRHMDRNASTLSDDLLGLKEYVMGDDVRLIHWKTSSRSQEIFIRHRERQATLPVVVILDCEERSYASTKEFDSATRVIASISYAALNNDIPCSLFCNDNGEFTTTHSATMDRLSVSLLSPYVQSKADSDRQLEAFDKNYLFITGSHGEVFSSAVLTLKIVSTDEILQQNFNMIPLRTSNECEDYNQRIKQWNAHASLQSL